MPITKHACAKALLYHVFNNQRSKPKPRWTPYPEQVPYSLAWFLHNTETTQDGCMEWLGNRSPYPRITISYKQYYVHRIIAFYFKVKHPLWRMFLMNMRFIVVMHTCDNPPCINPDHLCIDTQLANIWDSINKGRRPRSLYTTYY